jgi:hypothetical protein
MINIFKHDLVYLHNEVLLEDWFNQTNVLLLGRPVHSPNFNITEKFTGVLESLFHARQH